MDNGHLQSNTVFFHRSNSTLDSDHYFQEWSRIFEFRIMNNPANNNRSEARDIRLIQET